MRIAITGAGGNVGRQALSALDDHEVTPVTHRDHEEVDGVTLDVRNRDAFVDVLAGHDVLVHLAANPSPEADWADVLDTNVEGTYNAYEAAVANGVDRVVFASSNHAVGTYNTDDPTRTEAMTDGPAEAITPDTPPRPDSYYGVSKVAGEAIGSYYADRHGIEVVTLRIGWLMTADELAETQADDDARARFARAMWLSPRDCRAVIRCAATASIPRNPLVANAVSRNAERTLSLTETQQALGYRPRDDAAEALDRTA